MSVLIKGMDMPKNCEECHLESFCDKWVEARKMCGEYKLAVKATIRHPDCPLVPADVRPAVWGSWYWDEDDMGLGIGAWRCSACGATSEMWWNCDRGSPMHKAGHSFCPNCGADMRGES